MPEEWLKQMLLTGTEASCLLFASIRRFAPTSKVLASIRGHFMFHAVT